MASTPEVIDRLCAARVTQFLTGFQGTAIFHVAAAPLATSSREVNERSRQGRSTGHDASLPIREITDDFSARILDV